MIEIGENLFFAIALICVATVFGILFYGLLK